ncbi:HET-domain-containing protein [Hypoxylon sp. FL1150]|nr:HET-domain-containing protein [Hypoxylon sp. FL1150]
MDTAPQFAYTQVARPNEIRILTLHPGVHDDTLQGSIRHIDLPTYNSPNPSFSSDLRQPNTRALQNTRRLLDVFEAQAQENSHSIHSADSGGNAWHWELSESRRDSVRRSIHGREFFVEEPVVRFECKRVEYDQDTYDALSYTWGNLEKTNHIIIDGESLDITNNLYMALTELRSPTRSRRLWIDAICIDQENIQERNHQVHMMKRIFGSASSVIVWLGVSKGSVIDTLEMILKYSWSRGRKDLFKYPEESLRGLETLFNPSWWKRIWIVQEVVAVREIVVLLGDTIFPWIMLANICRAIQLVEFLAHPLAPMIRSCGYQKFTALDHFRRNRSMPLVRLVHCTQDYQATDLRDKLYALLGMASDISPDDIIPDYTKSVQQVFLDLVRFMAVEHRNLDIISSGRSSISGTSSPSWLPDWKGTNQLRPLNSEEFGGHFYQASGNTYATVHMTEFPDILVAEGWITDTIDLFDDIITDSHVDLQTIQRWQRIASENVNPTIRTSLFWRTIVMDKDHMGNQATPSFGKALNDFISGSHKTRSKFVQQFSDAVTRAVLGRLFFITKDGRMGLGPPQIQPGDHIAILKGCHVPLVLREAGDYMVLVGEAYVSAMMNGELVSDLVEGWYTHRSISLK